MVDTAGIRNTEDTVEKIGVERAKKISEDADLILYVIDSSVPLDEDDENIVRLIKGRKTIILFNKSDLEEVVTKEEVEILLSAIFGSEKKDNIFMVKISAKENDGIDSLVDLIKDMFFHGKIGFNDELYITNARHKEAVLEALESIRQVQVSLENDMPEDFYSIDLMSAYAALGRIIGEEVEDDLVNEIFSKFCMGK